MVKRAFLFSCNFEFSDPEFSRLFDVVTGEIDSNFLEFQAAVIVSFRRAIEQYLDGNDFELTLGDFYIGPISDGKDISGAFEEYLWLRKTVFGDEEIED